MKEVLFSKLKGKPNKDPHCYALVFKDELVEVKRSAVIIKCRNFEEYTETLKFLLAYYCTSIDRDFESFKIYIPREVIFKVNELDDDYEEVKQLL